jgi:integral membrane protein
MRLAELRSAPAVRSAFGRYRVMAYVVGVMLLVLVFVGMPLKYFAGQPLVVAVVGTAHGFLFVVYLASAFDLALKARWRFGRTILVLLAGTVPFMSFVMERRVERDLRGLGVVAPV